LGDYTYTKNKHSRRGTHQWLVFFLQECSYKDIRLNECLLD